MWLEKLDVDRDGAIRVFAAGLPALAVPQIGRTPRP
jgi:hypothetical protein